MRPVNFEIYYEKFSDHPCWRVRIVSSNGRKFGHQYNTKYIAQASIKSLIEHIKKGSYKITVKEK